MQKKIIHQLALGVMTSILAVNALAATVDILFKTKMPISKQTKSITINFYDCQTHKVLGSVCLNLRDLMHVKFNSNKLKNIYFGAHEHTFTCVSKRQLQLDQQSDPSADQFTNKHCYNLQQTKTNKLLKIYPDDFVDLAVHSTAGV